MIYLFLVCLWFFCQPESSLQETQVIEAPPEEHVDTRNVKPPETKTELAPDIKNLVMEKLQSSAKEDEEPLTMHILGLCWS